MYSKRGHQFRLFAPFTCLRSQKRPETPFRSRFLLLILGGYPRNGTIFARVGCLSSLAFSCCMYIAIFIRVTFESSSVYRVIHVFAQTKAVKIPFRSRFLLLILGGYPRNRNIFVRVGRLSSLAFSCCMNLAIFIGVTF